MGEKLGPKFIVPEQKRWEGTDKHGG